MIRRLRQIRYLQSVVRHHSFSKAAEECHISQSAISQQIRALMYFLWKWILESRTSIPNLIAEAQKYDEIMMLVSAAGFV